MRKATLATVVALSLAIAGCATTTDDAAKDGSTTTKQESGAPAAGAALTIGTTDKITSLDPAGSYDAGSFLVMNQVYGFLMNSVPGDGGASPSPDIAESAEFTSPTEYTVKLKKDLKFANGHDLTSSDVKFSFDRQVGIADPNGPASLLGNMEKVDAPDDTTVVFTLKVANDQTWAQVLSSPAGPIVDEEVFAADKIASDDEIINGKSFSGPYSVASYSKNDLVSYEKNPNYAGNQPAKTEKVNYKYYTDASNLRLNIQEGNIDVAWRSLSATDIESLGTDDKLVVHYGPGGEIRYLVFNHDTMPFGAKTPEADPKKAQAVRKAISSMIDRQAVADSVYKGTYTPLWSYIPDGLPGSGTQFKD
ncbi:MAG: peptide ABC transporter substrate-binding protein, partial [Actinomycetales bacterium]